MLARTSAVICLLALAAHAQIQLNNNLLLRYDFESLPATDSSPFLRGQAQTGGTPNLVTGKFGKAAQFNADGKQTDILYATQYPLTAPFTVTSWFTLSSTALNDATVYGKIVSYKTKADDVNGFELEYHAGGKWTVVLPGPSYMVYTQPTPFNAGDWHHVALVITAGQASLYLDGAVVVTQPYSGSILFRGTGVTGKDITVGGSATLSAANPGGLWRGNLDEFRIYGVALSDQQVLSVYNEVTPVATAGTATPSVGQLSSSCPAAAAVSSPSLVAVADNVKNADGNLMSPFQTNFVTLHNTANRRDYIVNWDGAIYDNTIQVNDKTKVVITNTGTKTITISSYKLDDAYFTITGATAGALAPGATTSFTVTFVATTAPGAVPKTLIQSKLHVLSDDSVQPSLDIILSGLFMSKPEGGNELPLQTILNGFGLSIDTQISYLDLGIENMNAKLLVDEVNAHLWTSANPNQPVQALQLAAFGGITNPSATHSFWLQIEGSDSAVCQLDLAALWAQTILPSCSGSSYQQCLKSCDVGTNHFTVINDKYSSNPALKQADGTTNYIDMIAFRFFPARTLDGTLVPNTYVVVQDYSLPKGCCDGDGCANCDYNDNVWILSNVRPADSEFIVVNNLPYATAFSQVSTGTVVDSNGVGLPFVDFFSNLADTRDSVSSYNPAGVTLDTSKGTYTIATTNGSPLNSATGGLVNALRVRLNPNNKAFVASVTIDTSSIGSASAGIMLGSDQKNFVLVYYKSGTITATARLTASNFNDDKVFTSFNSTTYNLGTASLTLGSSLTLAINVNPVTGAISAGAASNGNVAQVGSTWVVPGVTPGIGIRSAGRLWGYGVGVAPVAWSDSAPSNVKFTGLASDFCGLSSEGGNVATGTSATSSATVTGNNNGNQGTVSNTATNGNGNGNGNTNVDNQVTQRGSASGLVASFAFAAAVLFMTL